MARRKLTPPRRPPRKKLPRKPPKIPIPVRRRPPAPAQWLKDHPSIAAAIKWQFRSGSSTNYYAPPAETDKVAWPAWTARQQKDLSQAYRDCRDWLAAGAPQVAMAVGGLTDTPTNLHGNVADDTVTVNQVVSPDYMWKLYIAHVALALALETTQRLPWSIGSLRRPTLRYLFDSSTMAWNVPNGDFSLGTYAARVPALRADNRPKTAFAPPKWTYPFLVQAGLIGNTRRDTIGRVLEWMRQNLAHFIGADLYGTCDAVWQYRGYPPLSRIVNGTIDANNPGLSTQHWTLGCHGSVGFLNAVLRVVNIPVQPVWIAGHELAYFASERAYLDHGDDPYNLNVKNSTAPVLKLLIDRATYSARFTSDATVNITDINSPALANVGYAAANFPP